MKVSQIKIYAHQETITQYRQQISDAIHTALIVALQYPPDKKFQRFIALDPENFIYPKDRTEHYMIIEISMFEGRTKEAKKQFIQQIFTNLNSIGIMPQAVEITIFETPKENWGIRGKNADELVLNYQVEV